MQPMLSQGERTSAIYLEFILNKQDNTETTTDDL